jgi:hypothetical protein
MTTTLRRSRLPAKVMTAARRRDAALGGKDDDLGEEAIDLPGSRELGGLIAEEAGREIGEVVVLDLEFGVVEA